MGCDRVDHRPGAGGVAVGGNRQIQIGRLTAGKIVGTQVASGQSRVARVVDDEFVGVAVAYWPSSCLVIIPELDDWC